VWVVIGSLGTALALIALLLWLGFRRERRGGELEQKWKQAEREKDEAWRAKAARERLDSDPDARDKLRRKYTRLL
jgi:Flp pilus assembly protein TadB